MDLIDRQAAIDAIENTDAELSTKEWDELTDSIMALPSAQPEQQWIPCEVRLPKPNQLVGHVTKYYLIQDEFGDMMVASYNRNTDGVEWWEQMNSFVEIKDKVVAWMELPKAYDYEPEWLGDCGADRENCR